LSFWEKGWITRLTGSAAALLIVLLDMQGGRKEPQYLSNRERRARGLSADTWTRATKELTTNGLVTVGHAKTGPVHATRTGCRKTA